ncbi:hypothetical protein [Rhodococcus opacus]|uniref:hypothetical protein n=1 Tax=Rhodococcus TaxID=1827 RepID=UPI000A9AFD64|nr:hypothetical protein [Rhodococcus opacus]
MGRGRGFTATKRQGDPTTELLLAHKHPDEHPNAARVLDRLHDDTGQLTRNHGR